MPDKPALNLPQFTVKLRVCEQKEEIWDIFRRRWVVCNPEEWVRQQFLHWLHHDLSYPKELIAVEPALKYNKLPRRPDAVVFSKSAKPIVVIECKRPEVNITQDTFNQVAMYNYVLQAPYLILTNGLQHYCAKVNVVARKISFLEQIPAWPMFLDHLSAPS